MQNLDIQKLRHFVPMATLLDGVTGKYLSFACLPISSNSIQFVDILDSVGYVFASITSLVWTESSEKELLL